jgi:hypothetical protein
MNIWIAAIVSAILAGPASAQPFPQPIDVPQRAFRETLTPRAQSSGVQVVGLVGGQLGGLTPRSSPLLTITGINPRSQYLCVRVFSANGLYVASLSMRTPQTGTNPTLRIPARKMSEGSPRLGGLAVSAFHSPTSECSAPSELLGAFWGPASQPERSLYLAVNSYFADRGTTRIRVNAAAQSSPCLQLNSIAELREVPMQTFDQLCPLALPKKCGESTR